MKTSLKRIWPLAKRRWRGNLRRRLFACSLHLTSRHRHGPTLRSIAARFAKAHDRFSTSHRKNEADPTACESNGLALDRHYTLRLDARTSIESCERTSYEDFLLLLFSYSSRTLWYFSASFSSSGSDKCSMSIISLWALSIDLMISSSFK